MCNVHPFTVDETYIHVHGKRHYLYRVVNKQGKRVDFLHVGIGVSRRRRLAGNESYAMATQGC
jgi:transposase-like protein